jgi:hypothetical protein
LKRFLGDITKQQWHEEHWQEELQNAFEAGKRMAEKIMA